MGVDGAIFGVLYWAILRVYRANTKENMKANIGSYLDQLSAVYKLYLHKYWEHLCHNIGLVCEEMIGVFM